MVLLHHAQRRLREERAAQLQPGPPAPLHPPPARGAARAPLQARPRRVRRPDGRPPGARPAEHLASASGRRGSDRLLQPDQPRRVARSRRAEPPDGAPICDGLEGPVVTASASGCFVDLLWVDRGDPPTWPLGAAASALGLLRQGVPDGAVTFSPWLEAHG